MTNESTPSSGTSGHQTSGGQAATSVVSSVASSPLDNVRVSSDIKTQMQTNSPLELLNNIPTNTPIVDPNKLANEILAKEHAKANPPKVDPAVEVPPEDNKPKIDVTYETAMQQSQREGRELLARTFKQPAPTVEKTEVAPVPDFTVKPEETKATPDSLSVLDQALKGELKESETPETPETKEEVDPLADVPEELPDESSEEGKNSAKENFKKMRTRTKALHEEKKNLSTQLAEANKLLENYKSGAALPEVVQNLEQKVGELSKYRDLVDMKLSPEYETAYVQPLNNLGAQLEAYATEYEVPSEALYHALSLEKPAELSRFLSDHFDPAAALEVKGIISNIQKIRGEALEAEKQPAKHFEALKQDHKRIKEVKETQRINSIDSTAKSAWSNAVQKIQQEGEATELVWQENNSDHNEKTVQVFRNFAAKEFGKIVRNLAEKGITELEPAVAEALARATLLSVISANAINSRNNIINEANDLEKNVSHLSSIMRPSIGSSNGTGSISDRSQDNKPKAAPTPAKEGAVLLKDLKIT